MSHHGGFEFIRRNLALQLPKNGSNLQAPYGSHGIEVLRTIGCLGTTAPVYLTLTLA